MLLVGAGPAALAVALRLAPLMEQHNAAIDSGAKGGVKYSPENICILEKRFAPILLNYKGFIMRR